LRPPKKMTEKKIISPSDAIVKAKKFRKENPNGLIVIVGQTASGKTSFSLQLTKKLQNAEIISVDSRQIYKDINISSAKITEEEQQNIPHWGLDLISPEETFSVFDLQQYAFGKIKEILQRKNTPILCGGTMLWIDAITKNYIFNEKGTKSQKKGPQKYPYIKFGMYWNRKKLYERINLRAEKNFQDGLEKETKEILEKYPKISLSAKSSFGYEEIISAQNKEKAKEKNKQRNRNYAKRQNTWWKKDEEIIWIQGCEDVSS